MKRILTLGLVLLLITSMTSIVYAKDSSIRVNVDQKNVLFTDSSPFIDENNRTLVPLRAIGESMGLVVDWDNAAKTATFTKVYNLKNTPAIDGDSFVGKETVTFTIGSKKARLTAYFYPQNYIVQGADDMNYSTDGWADISMDTAAIIRDARTYAPVRYLAESFRFETKWNSSEKIVELYSSKAPGEVDLSMEAIASWEDYQGWAYLAGKDSKIESVEVLSVLRGQTPLAIRILTMEEKAAIEEILPALSTNGEYVAGFVADSKLEMGRSYKYTFKLQITMENGTREMVTYNKYLYYDGGQGGII